MKHLPLIDAAYDGNIEDVQEQLDAGANVNEKDNDANTALHLAIGEGHLETVELLIAAGADLDAMNNGGGTPLFFAIGEGNLEIVELLIAAGADLDATYDLTTPLDQAVSSGYDKIADLLRNNAALTGEALSIFIAVKKGSYSAVKQHLADGEDVNSKDYGGRTLLHYAASHNETEIAEMLIAKGADVNARIISPGTVCFDIGQTPIHDSATAGHIEMVELLIAKKADVNAKNELGQSPLFSAVRKLNSYGSMLTRHQPDKFEMVKLLVSKGADVNAKDEDGCTPLHELARFILNASTTEHSGLYEEFVDRFISKGADVNAKDKYGRTPLDSAHARSPVEIINLLRKHGGKTKKELKTEGKLKVRTDFKDIIKMRKF